MRSIRLLLTAAGAFALLGAVSGCGTALANTSSGVWIQVNPGTIAAGSVVKITATCGDSNNSATVSSIVFGTIRLLPQASLLVGQVTVPQKTAPGTFAVDLTCKTGSTATTTLTVIGSNAVPVTPGAPTMGPHTGGGFLANGGSSGSPQPGVWIGGGLAAILAAAAIATLSRRRRAVPVRRSTRRR